MNSSAIAPSSRSQGPLDAVMQKLKCQEPEGASKAAGSVDVEAFVQDVNAKFRTALFDTARDSIAESGLKISQAKDIPITGKRTKALETYSASSLYGIPLARPPIVIQNMVSVGLNVLAAPPKYGKSYMADDMGISVATGTPFLGMMTRQGDVLYLDLESRQYRAQDRLSQLMPGKFPERLFIAHDAERIDVGLMDQLEQWCKEHPQTSLIIIDTLGRVKGGSKRGENAYEGDTRIFGELQRFAQQHKLAVLVVHHLKKSGGRGEDSDPVERISGSMGLAGVCDTILMLSGRSGEAERTLSVTARDFESAEYILGFDRGIWTLKATDSEAYRESVTYSKSGVVRGVISLMNELRPASWRGTAAQLLEAIQGASQTPIGVYTAREASAELETVAQMLFRNDNILVRRSTVHGKRIISIERIESDLTR